MTNNIQIKVSNRELSKFLDTLIDNIKKTLGQSTNITISVAWKFLQLAVAEIIKAIEINNPNLVGIEKKQIAIIMIGNFYDKVFTTITIPYIPLFLQPLLQKYMKILLMTLVGATIDSMVQIFRQNGIFLDPNSTNKPTILKKKRK